jgi:hypothetical protein
MHESPPTVNSLSHFLNIDKAPLPVLHLSQTGGGSLAEPFSKSKKVRISRDVLQIFLQISLRDMERISRMPYKGSRINQDARESLLNGIIPPLSSIGLEVILEPVSAMRLIPYKGVLICLTTYGRQQRRKVNVKRILMPIRDA